MSQTSPKRSTRSSTRTSTSLAVPTTPRKTSKKVASFSKTKSSSSSQPPTFPVEILTEIFKLAFGYPSPASTPSSPPTPHKDVPSLLLASRTFRAVALPLVFSSVTIRRSRDWVTFFGAGRGIFVVGEEGRIRRRTLKEICLVAGVRPPLHFDESAPFSLTLKPDDGVEYIAPLDLSEIHIESFVVLDFGWRETRFAASLDDKEEEEVLSQIVANVVDDVKVRAKVRREIARDQGTKFSDVDDWEVDEFVDTSVRWTANDSQKRAFLPLLQALKPQTIRLNPRCSTFSKILTVVTRDPVRIVTYGGSSWGGGLTSSRLHRAFPVGSFESSEEEQRRIQREKEQQEKKEEEL